MRMHVCAYMFVCVYMCMHMCVYMCVCVYVHLCVCVYCACVIRILSHNTHTHKHTHTHTYTHTHTHTHTARSGDERVRGAIEFQQRNTMRAALLLSKVILLLHPLMDVPLLHPLMDVVVKMMVMIEISCLV